MKWMASHHGVAAGRLALSMIDGMKTLIVDTAATERFVVFQPL
jgi:hypothetical protein